MPTKIRADIAFMLAGVAVMNSQNVNDVQARHVGVFGCYVPHNGSVKFVLTEEVAEQVARAKLARITPSYEKLLSVARKSGPPSYLNEKNYSL